MTSLSTVKFQGLNPSQVRFGDDPTAAAPVAAPPADTSTGPAVKPSALEELINSLIDQVMQQVVKFVKVFVDKFGAWFKTWSDDLFKWVETRGDDVKKYVETKTKEGQAAVEGMLAGKGAAGTADAPAPPHLAWVNEPWFQEMTDEPLQTALVEASHVLKLPLTSPRKEVDESDEAFMQRIGEFRERLEARSREEIEQVSDKTPADARIQGAYQILNHFYPDLEPVH